MFTARLYELYHLLSQLPSSAQLQLQLASARSAGLRWSLLSIFIPPTHPSEKISGLSQLQLQLYNLFSSYSFSTLDINFHFQLQISSFSNFFNLKVLQLQNSSTSNFLTSNFFNFNILQLEISLTPNFFHFKFLPL